MNNQEAGLEIFTVLPVKFFLRVARNALIRAGFVYNDYVCIFGRDPEADPGREFDGVRVSLLGDEYIITELDLFEGALNACAYFLSNHPAIAPELKDIANAISQEIVLLQSDKTAGKM